MRAILFLLSLSALLFAGTYTATTLWPNQFAPENHEPLDSLADEIISHSELGKSIDRSLSDIEGYVKQGQLSLQERERLSAYYQKSKERLRTQMREEIKSQLLHTLTREDLIEIKRSYQNESIQKFSALLNSSEQKSIFGLPWAEIAQLKASSSALNRAPASTSK